MDEHDALKKMVCKDEDALAWFIDRYAPYVSTIIYNILGSFVDSSDLTIEQVVDRILEIFRARTEEGASHES